MITQTNWKSVYYDYIRDVLSGDVVAGKKMQYACQRQLDDEERERTDDDFPYFFDEFAADQICWFISLLTHSTGEYAGQSFGLKPWQIFIVRTIFGWRHTGTGCRRYRDAFVSCGRGNGKSPLGAAILLYLFGFDYPFPEPRAEAYCVATKRDQAKIIFEEAKRFVTGSPYLCQRIRRWRASLSIDESHCKLGPLGSDSKTTDGLVPHGVAIDELHAWQERHRELREKITTALAKRRQSLCLIVTTAGNEDSELWLEECSVCEQVVDRNSPVTADELFVAIFDIDDEDDPFDEGVWCKANPMLEYGIVKVDQLQAMKSKADVLPDLKVQFKRYHCNRFTTSFTKAFTPEEWGKGSRPIPWDDLEEVDCFAGFDWGSRDDLAAMALVWPLVIDDRRHWAIHAKCWCPEETKKRRLVRDPWARWIEQGDLIPTSGDTTDPDALWAQLVEWQEKFYIRSLAGDPHNARAFLTRAHNELGLDLYECPQTPRKFHEPTRELEFALHEGRVLHGNNELLAWSAFNVVLKEDAAGYVMPNKRRSQDKIDPIVAVIMAIGEALYAARVEDNWYESNELEMG